MPHLLRITQWAEVHLLQRAASFEEGTPHQLYIAYTAEVDLLERGAFIEEGTPHQTFFTDDVIMVVIHWRFAVENESAVL